MYKKILISFAITIILIGISFQPILAIEPSESIDIRYFDVTTEFVGLGKNHITKLTEEEIEKLDYLFDSIIDKLKNTFSFEETNEIFKEAIIELNNYGLLDDIGVKESEKLVFNCYYNTKFMDIGINKNYPEKKTMDDNENFLCLIAGKTNQTVIISLFGIAYLFLIFLIASLLYGENFWAFICVIYWYVYQLMFPLCLGRPISFRNNLSYGKISTFGLNGRKNWEGNLTGKIYSILFKNYCAAIGFTGLKISIERDYLSYYIGFSPYVHIESV